MMESKSINELEHLLAALAEKDSLPPLDHDGAVEELVHKIEQMLIDNPDLQDHYWSWMNVHLVLGAERSAILQSHRGVGPSNTLSRDELQQRLSPAPPRKARQRNWMVAAVLALAACIGWAFIVLSGQDRQVADEQTAPPTPPASETPASASKEEHPWRIPQITRVSWEGPFFASSAMAEGAPADADAGPVALGFSRDLSANGYLLKLSPGVAAELLLTADAVAENSLSVTEIDARGTPIRRSVTFNNCGPETLIEVDDSGVESRRYGLVGTWSEYNDTTRTKYYLINGIHKLSDPEALTHASQVFQLSDMELMIDEPEVVLIGWDDGGLKAPDGTISKAPDGDFDDLTVLVRMHRPAMPMVEAHTSSKIHNWKAPRENPQVTDEPQTEGATRYRFNILPGELAALNLSSEASACNAFFVVDESTGEVLWSMNNSKVAANNLGSVSIENNGTATMHLAVFAEHLPKFATEDSVWNCSDMRKVNEQPGCVILGFEDGGKDDDYDDVRVVLMKMSRSRLAPIDDL